MKIIRIRGCFQEIGHPFYFNAVNHFNTSLQQRGTMDLHHELAVIILAAGKGTRMKSEKAKVLHQVSGKTMVFRVVDCAVKIAGKNVHVVVGHQAEEVKKEINQFFDVKFALQTQLLGTGDAVKSAVPGLAQGIKHVLVLCGDVPLIKEQTLKNLVAEHITHENKITVLATDIETPAGYGRIVFKDNGQMKCIREEADASVDEKKIKKVNTGIYCFEKQLLIAAINELKPDNNQAEYYLTDVIEIAQKKQEKIGVVTMLDHCQVMGVNTLEDLETVQSLIL